VEKLITGAEFARRTGLPKTTVWRYIREGLIRSGQPGGAGKRLWIAETEVERVNALLQGEK
jgi:DNA-binding transcriptional MerR regulator